MLLPHASGVRRILTAALAAAAVDVTYCTLQGAKLQYGHVPVGTRGDDDVSRQFRSLHAVQRHMVRISSGLERTSTTFH